MGVHLPPRRDVLRQFWLLIRAGRMRTEAATELGYVEGTGKRWFGQAGGIMPAFVLAQTSGRCLSFAERELIFAGVERGESIRFIARLIGRAPSTVLRELRRNMGHRYRTRERLYVGRGAPRLLPWDYRPSLAQQRAADSGPIRSPIPIESDHRFRSFRSPRQEACGVAPA